jgi:hypothetical protein
VCCLSWYLARGPVCVVVFELVCCEGWYCVGGGGGGYRLVLFQVSRWCVRVVERCNILIVDCCVLLIRVDWCRGAFTLNGWVVDRC